jgi:hypothetical protein
LRHRKDQGRLLSGCRRRAGLHSQRLGPALEDQEDDESEAEGNGAIASDAIYPGEQVTLCELPDIAIEKPLLEPFW